MVVLHFDKGLYFGLNVNLASAQQPRKVQEICDAILREHEVSNEQCERELLTLLGETLRKRVVFPSGSSLSTCAR
jgi:hypothetical protein